MRKKLIAAIVVVLLLIAAAFGVILYMENKPDSGIEQTTAPENSEAASTGAETEAVVETTEETVYITFPTEDPSDVTPEDTFGEEDIVPPVTGDISTGETEAPDSNETPEDEF